MNSHLQKRLIIRLAFFPENTTSFTYKNADEIHYELGPKDKWVQNWKVLHCFKNITFRRMKVSGTDKRYKTAMYNHIISLFPNHLRDRVWERLYDEVNALCDECLNNLTEKEIINKVLLGISDVCKKLKDEETNAYYYFKIPYIQKTVDGEVLN